ncbi:MAG TPA: arsenite methyltransferase [Halanaerobiales bacterium]|nr:arsenite methyltransferase [Halanaerobiales bacterium]
MDKSEKELKELVKENYKNVVKDNKDCCNSSSCCGNKKEEIVEKMDYSQEEINSVFKEANYGLGCGNPGSIANLKEREVVLDLGCGAGFDVFLASSKVGSSGKVFGVDMTEEMIKKARNNADKNDIKNVEFLLGEIEDLPIEDNTIDVIISNCVINLSPNKERVFKEAKRVLKKGGRIAISDILKDKEFPNEIMSKLDNYSSCITGSIKKDKVINILDSLNFKDIEIERKTNSDEIVEDWISGFNIHKYIYSAYIRAKI